MRAPRQAEYAPVRASTSGQRSHLTEPSVADPGACVGRVRLERQSLRSPGSLRSCNASAPMVDLPKSRNELSRLSRGILHRLSQPSSAAGLAALLALMMPELAEYAPAIVDLMLTVVAIGAAIVAMVKCECRDCNGRDGGWPLRSLRPLQRKKVRNDIIGLFRGQCQVRHGGMGCLEEDAKAERCDRRVLGDLEERRCADTRVVDLVFGYDVTRSADVSRQLTTERWVARQILR